MNTKIKFLQKIYNLTHLILNKTDKKNNKEIDNKFNLEIPTGSKFIHKCYIECARIFWKNPYL